MINNIDDQSKIARFNGLLQAAQAEVEALKTELLAVENRLSDTEMDLTKANGFLAECHTEVEQSLLLANEDHNKIALYEEAIYRLCSMGAFITPRVIADKNELHPRMYLADERLIRKSTHDAALATIAELRAEIERLTERGDKHHEEALGERAMRILAEAEIKRLRDAGSNTNLFIDGEFTTHSGETLPFKIDCDALTDDDIKTLAKEISRRMRFSRVVGIPRGGLRLAEALGKYCQPDTPILIVDDVLTTGHSMEAERRVFPSAIGAVIFARGACPEWVTPLFSVKKIHAPAGDAKENLAKVSDETIYELRDQASGDDDEVVSVKSSVLFDICVEIEIRRYDAALTAAEERVRQAGRERSLEPCYTTDAELQAADDNYRELEMERDNARQAGVREGIEMAAQRCRQEVDQLLKRRETADLVTGEKGALTIKAAAVECLEEAIRALLPPALKEG